MDSWKFLQATQIEKWQKLLYLHISQKNTLTGIVQWPPYYPTLQLMNGEEFFQ